MLDFSANPEVTDVGHDVLVTEPLNNLRALDRRLYAFAELDQLIGLHSGTAKRWLEGYTRRGKQYPPLLREAATGDELATWGEFVEAGLVAEYRDRGASVQHLRAVIVGLRKELQVPYPLAHARPFHLGRELIRDLQQETGLPGPLQLVVAKTNQLVLAAPVERYLKRVEFDADDTPVRVHPGGLGSLVRFDPLRAFGRPTVVGIPTDRLNEAFVAGDSLDYLARVYELPLAAVEAAVRYEALAHQQAAG